ncbi:MAG: putative alpha,2-mannosidase [Nevskia sp.]|nr:putative alpha,2-mannosidase [Nevskia sp.]
MVCALASGAVLLAACGSGGAPGSSTPADPGQSAPPTSGTAALAYVDPFIGSEGDHGQLDAAATRPFGLVKLGPETGGASHTGYQYQNPALLGFSHTRLEGIGCAGAGGTLLLKPALGLITSDAYDKSSEQAAPGYYTVTFNNGLLAELTASVRVGMHRYAFPASARDAMVYIDSTNSYSPLVGSALQQADASTLTGYVDAGSACATEGDKGNRRYKLYYALRFDHPIGKLSAAGTGKAWADFGASPTGMTLQAKVALSPIDVPTAVAELDADLPGWDFAAARQAASDSWARELGRIEVIDKRPETTTQRTLFYTTLYRTLLAPHNVTSSAGTYRRAGDEATLRHVTDIAPDYVSYAGWSTWDDFHRYALLSLVYPDAARNIVRSIAEMYTGGHLQPGWADGYWPAPSVRDEFMPAVLLDAYGKGLADFDLAAVYDAGIPVAGNQQLEQPYGNYLKMRFAEALGRSADVDQLKKLALGYSQYWAASQQDADGTTRGFFTLDGKTVPPASVDQVAKYFYQGNLWHYRFLVPHDIQGLANLRGSREALSDDLEFYFDTWRHQALNETPLAYPFLFDYLGKPYLTQKWSRAYTTETVTSLYTTSGRFLTPVVRPAYQATPDGWLPGMDDDTGAMSSQYVFQAMGLYPACVGDPYYVIGSPIFPELRLNLPGGKQFIIRADGVSEQNFYIQSATLDGVPYNQPWISYQRIAAGGTLELQMGSTPNTAWGADPAMAPPSLSAPAQ